MIFKIHTLWFSQYSMFSFWIWKSCNRLKLFLPLKLYFLQTRAMFSLNLTCFSLHLSWAAHELSTEVLADISKKVTDSGLLRIMMTNTTERAVQDDTSPGLRFVLIIILVIKEIICGGIISVSMNWLNCKIDNYCTLYWLLDLEIKHLSLIIK